MSNWEIRAKEPFADPTNLTKWTIWSLAAFGTLAAVAMGSDLLERQFLLQVQADQFASQDDLEAAGAANDLRQLMVAIVQMAFLATSAVLSLKWIYRANLNTWRLGAEGLEYSPGWAVGYFFVPILNLWKPFQVLKEIWRASANPKHWKSASATALLPLWWTLFLFSSSVGQAAFRLELRAEGLSQYVTANMFSIAANVLEIALTVVFILLIRQIYRMQMEQSTMRTAPDMRDAVIASA